MIAAVKILCTRHSLLRTSQDVALGRRAYQVSNGLPDSTVGEMRDVGGT